MNDQESTKRLQTLLDDLDEIARSPKTTFVAITPERARAVRYAIEALDLMGLITSCDHSPMMASLRYILEEAKP